MRKTSLIPDFGYCLRLFYATIFLIFSIEFLRRIDIYFFYAGLKDILRVNSFLLVIMLVFAITVSVFTTIILSFIKNKKLAYSLVELICLIVFTLHYTYVLLCLDKSTILLKYMWGTRICPIIIPLCCIYFYVKYSNIIKRWIINLLNTLWVPVICITMCSIIWLTVIFAHTLSEKQTGLGIQPQDLTGHNVKRPNIILLTFDALTTKDMSLHGYHRETTPELEKFAGECFVFNNMFSNYVSTTPSVVSMFTSKYPWEHGALDTGAYLGDGREKTLFSLLPEYNKIAVIGVEFADIRLIGLGGKNVEIISALPHSIFLADIDSFLYNYLHNTIPVNELPIFSKIMPRRASDSLFLKGNSDENKTEYIFDAWESFSMAIDALEKTQTPFFIWLHIFQPNPHASEPHATDPPPPFRYTFTNRDTEIPDRLWANQSYPYKDQPYVDNFKALYDESILYIDYCTGKFLEKLKAMDLYNNTLIIISSDHGESFENGWRGHASAYLGNATTNVPLIIHLPGQSSGKFLDTPAETVDILPTIIDIIGKQPPQGISGETLVPYMKDHTKISTKPKYSLWYLYEQTGVTNFHIELGLSIIKDGYKLIGYPIEKRGMLYTLEDKDEKHNLAMTHSHIAVKLLQDTPEWINILRTKYSD